MEGVGERQAAGRQDAHPRRHHALDRCWSSIPNWSPQRIVRFASVVGRENVIAGTDCGFATFAGSKEIHPSIVWAKFKALSDGAAIASQQLWGK